MSLFSTGDTDKRTTPNCWAHWARAVAKALVLAWAVKPVPRTRDHFEDGVVVLLKWYLRLWAPVSWDGGPAGVAWLRALL